MKQKNKIINKEQLKVEELIPNPIVLRSNNINQELSEYALKELIINNIDENYKKTNHNKTIGIIICKHENKYVIKYCSDDRIFARKYEIVFYNKNNL